MEDLMQDNLIAEEYGGNITMLACIFPNERRH